MSLGIEIPPPPRLPSTERETIPAPRALLGARVRLTGSRYWPAHEAKVVAVQPETGRPETADVTIPDGRLARYGVEDLTVLEVTR